MSEAITAVGQLSAQTPDTKGLGNGTGHATSYDMRDFAAAMAKNAGQVDGSQALSATSTSASPPPSEGLRSLLSTFDKLNGGVDKIKALTASLEGGAEFSPAQLLQVTVVTQEFMFSSQLTSSVANKTSDGVQQLFRQQS